MCTILRKVHFLGQSFKNPVAFLQTIFDYK